MSFVEVEQNIGINKNDQDFTYTPHPAVQDARDSIYIIPRWEDSAGLGIVWINGHTIWKVDFTYPPGN